jgi:hypothetical protein
MKPSRNTIQDGIVIAVPGEHIRFNNGEYETSDKSEIDFIKRHRFFGSKITEVTEEKPTRQAAAAQ